MWYIFLDKLVCHWGVFCLENGNSTQPQPAALTPAPICDDELAILETFTNDDNCPLCVCLPLVLSGLVVAIRLLQWTYINTKKCCQTIWTIIIVNYCPSGPKCTLFAFQVTIYYCNIMMYKQQQQQQQQKCVLFIDFNSLCCLFEICYWNYFLLLQNFKLNI